VLQNIIDGDPGGLAQPMLEIGKKLLDRVNVG